jgi:MFS-type transporter involved in bile tolerance (Atg22 family)
VVLNGTSSVLYATVGEYVAQDRLPRAFGLFYTLGSLCGIAAPLGYGLIGDLYDVETSIAIIGIAIFLTVPLAALLKPAAASRLRSA